MNFINLKHENMTWYDTYEEIKAKYPDTVFEEYWLVEEDVAKLMNHEPIIKGWAIIKNDPNIDSDIISSNKMLLKLRRTRVMSAIYCCILGYYLHLMMIQ